MSLPGAARPGGTRPRDHVPAGSSSPPGQDEGPRYRTLGRSEGTAAKWFSGRHLGFLKLDKEDVQEYLLAHENDIEVSGFTRTVDIHVGGKVLKNGRLQAKNVCRQNGLTFGGRAVMKRRRGLVSRAGGAWLWWAVAARSVVADHLGCLSRPVADLQHV